MVKSRYQAHGFIPINFPPARRIMGVHAAISIVKGDILDDDTAGYATNSETSFSAVSFGVAAADCDNSAGAVGAKNVEYYPFDTKTQYIVPVENALITQTNVGGTYDISTADGLDVSDAETEGIAFRVDRIDVSAEAIVANAFGYAIGHFVVVGTQA